jgi:hypothetical protein
MVLCVTCDIWLDYCVVHVLFIMCTWHAATALCACFYHSPSLSQPAVMLLATARAGLRNYEYRSMTLAALKL